MSEAAGQELSCRGERMTAVGRMQASREAVALMSQAKKEFTVSWVPSIVLHLETLERGSLQLGGLLAAGESTEGWKPTLIPGLAAVPTLSSATSLVEFSHSQEGGEEASPRRVAIVLESSRREQLNLPLRPPRLVG